MMQTGEVKTLEYIDSSIDEGQTDEIIEPLRIMAQGFLIKETPEYITLAREMVTTKNGVEFRGQLSIPKGSIVPHA